MSSISRPRVPAEWYRPSLGWTAAFLVYAPLLVLMPVTASYLALTHVASWPLRLAIMIPPVVLGGYGFQLMGFVGHEGMHLSLTKNKLASACIGLFYASSVVSYFEMGFAAQHWTHHRFTNQSSDPDIGPVEHLDSWWKRLLFARAIYNAIYFVTTLRLARGGEWPFAYRMPFKKPTIRALAMANLAFALAWIGVYVAVAIHAPLLFFGCVAPSMLTALFIAGCQTFIDHAGVGDEPYRNAWSRNSLGMTLVYFGANFHLEHHLYPGVPCYRLHKVHALLRAAGTLEAERVRVQPSFFASYGAIAKPYRLGAKDFAFDPFAQSSD